MLKLNMYIFLLIIMIVLYLCPYFITFNNGFSKSVDDFGIFGNYLSGLSALFSGVTLIVLIYDFIRSHKEKEIEKARESIRFIFSDFSIDENQKNHLVRYYEKKIQGLFPQMSQEWHNIHNVENEKLKKRLLFMSKLIYSEKLSEEEHFLYKDKIGRLFTEEQKNAVISIFEDYIDIKKMFIE